MSADSQTELDALLTADERRVKMAADENLIRSLGRDEIDRELDDMNTVDPYEVHGPSRRSDKDLSEFLSLLDSLETGNDREEATR